MFKTVKDYDKLDAGLFFASSNTSCRGHSLKLQRFRSSLDLRKCSFSQHVVDQWNLLTEDALSSLTLNVFTGRLAEHFRKNRDYKLRLLLPFWLLIYSKCFGI